MAEIMKLKELVAYQNDAIVSKTIVEKETGTVTLFAFDKDQALSEHTAPFDALVQVIDGRAEIRIAGVPHLVKRRRDAGHARQPVPRPQGPHPVQDAADHDPLGKQISASKLRKLPI